MKCDFDEAFFLLFKGKFIGVLELHSMFKWMLVSLFKMYRALLLSKAAFISCQSLDEFTIRR